MGEGEKEIGKRRWLVRIAEGIASPNGRFEQTARFLAVIRWGDDQNGGAG